MDKYQQPREVSSTVRPTEVVPRRGLPLLLILNQQKCISWVAHTLKSTKMHKWGSPRLKINKSGSPRLGTTSVGHTVYVSSYDATTEQRGEE